MAIKPVSPEECAGPIPIPDQIIEVVNAMLREKSGRDEIIITQDTLVKRILDSGFPYSRQEIFNNGWLDFEDMYRAAGWIVRYDKPGYNEPGHAFFTFVKKSAK